MLKTSTYQVVHLPSSCTVAAATVLSYTGVYMKERDEWAQAREEKVLEEMSSFHGGFMGMFAKMIEKM